MNVDLPAIEDIPKQKITRTPTGKQSIRNKSIKDINEDYVNCVCGLAILLAEKVFNISPVIKNVEITGVAQRQDSRTNLITDQCLFIVNFDRYTFSNLLFGKFTALQVLNFFQHDINVTKTMGLKEIDVNKAHDRLHKYVPIDQDDYFFQNPIFAKKIVYETVSGILEALKRAKK